MIEDVTTSGKSMEETVPKVRGAANVEIVGPVSYTHLNQSFPQNILPTALLSKLNAMRVLRHFPFEFRLINKSAGQ